MGLVSKCWKDQDDHQSLNHGPEECPLGKVPTQIEQRNTGVTWALGPCRLQGTEPCLDTLKSASPGLHARVSSGVAMCV